MRPEFLLAIAFAVSVVIVGSSYLGLMSPAAPATARLSLGECITDSDCVPKECCHPSTCVLKTVKQECGLVACTMECRPGTMDCGHGYCTCVNGECQAVMDW